MLKFKLPSPIIFALVIVFITACCCTGSHVEENASSQPVAVQPDSATVLSQHENPQAETHRVATHIVPGKLANIFCDSNHVQLAAAEANGFSPITDLRSAYHLKAPVVKLQSTDTYIIEQLSHSMPFLVPTAARLLADIAQSFADTLKARCGKAPYRIKVTSITRTDQTVSQLQQRNRNATTNSCHRYGTTFDISWSKFDCIDSSFKISHEDLKNILAEIVYDKRQKNLCYAKFERKQGCFHITVR